MPRKKVLILGKLPPPYMGPAIATSILLNSALKERYELLHLDTRINKSVATMGKWSPVKTLRSLGLYFRYIGLLLKEKPDLVLIPISQTTMGFIKDAVFLKWGWILGCKMVVQLRGSDLKNWQERSSKFTRWLYRFWVKKAEGAIVLGEGLRYLFEPEFLTKKIFVVPNGVDLEFPKSEIKEGKLKLLYLSNFLPGKGFLQVLEGLDLLDEELSGKMLLEAAGSWDNEEYMAKCSRLMDESAVEILIRGPVSGEDKSRLLAEADVFIFTPTAPEGLPWALIEAAAAGLPMISTDQGAIKDVVVDGKNGFILEAGSGKAIAEKLELLINDPELRERMGRASRMRYEDGFTEKTMVERMAEAFDNLIEN